MSTLRFFRGSELLLEFRLRPGRTSVGRADACDVALPGETVSRTHFLVQGRRDDWVVVDRSRHGVHLDGQRVSDRAPLADGSVLTFGTYRVEVRLKSQEARPTAPQEADQTHELLLANDSGGLQVQRAVLVVEEGPDAGRTVPLRHARLSVGGSGSHIELSDGTLERQHCWVRVSRSRAMVEPGQGATLLDGERVRDITPILGDETFRIGRTSLRIQRDRASELPLAGRFGDMVAESREMQRLFGTLRRMAGHHYTVLVVGESGTGKELIARGVHAHSPRGDGPFVALNCGAITESLFESELFGHEKGAFTGADSQRDGAFLEADGGTLFLDEIGELPEGAQAKLLRVLETGEVRRVGSTQVTYPDVRIVAATNRDLAQAVRDGGFRGDLFFRLAVLMVEVPPLRDRPEDLPRLCEAICHALHPGCSVTDKAMEVLRRHDWPGNVRELRNVLTRAYVLGGQQIDVEDLSFHRIAGLPTAPTAPRNAPGLDAAERDYLESVLMRHGGNRSAAARELGMARSTLHYKIKKYDLT